MNKDYTYCSTKDCIHRRGCRRSIENYTDKAVKELYTENRFVSEVDFGGCIPNYDDANCENNFGMLDRFRLSTGEEF